MRGLYSQNMRFHMLLFKCMLYQKFITRKNLLLKCYITNHCIHDLHITLDSASNIYRQRKVELYSSFNQSLSDKKHKGWRLEYSRVQSATNFHHLTYSAVLPMAICTAFYVAFG